MASKFELWMLGKTTTVAFIPSSNSRGIPDFDNTVSVCLIVKVLGYCSL